jgi:hypothetical protein
MYSHIPEDDEDSPWAAVIPMQLEDSDDVSSAVDAVEIMLDRLYEALDGGRVDVSHSMEYPEARPGQFDPGWDWGEEDDDGDHV